MTDVTTIYQEALRNTHAMERQGLVQMQAQVKGLDAYPDYAALLNRHIAITERQIGRLDAEIEEAKAGSSGLREAVTAVVGAVGTAIHAVMPDTVLKNLFAGYAYQHEQIAAYTSLKALAEAAGHGGHAGWIDETIEEERAAATEVEALIVPVTQAFVRQSAE